VLRYTFQTLIFHSACTRRLHYWGFILALLTWTPPVGMNRHPYWVTVVTFHTGDINFMLCRQTPPSIRQHPYFVLRSFWFHVSTRKAVTLDHDLFMVFLSVSINSLMLCHVHLTRAQGCFLPFSVVTVF